MSLCQQKTIKHASFESDENINDSSSDELNYINSVDSDKNNNSSVEESTEGKSLDKNTSITSRKISISDTDSFVNGTRRDRMKFIKHLLISKDSNICSICNLGFDCEGEKLVLQIDHINGFNNDNRLENLHYVCQICLPLVTFLRKNIR
jgi:hypothetical protein